MLTVMVSALVFFFFAALCGGTMYVLVWSLQIIHVRRRVWRLTGEYDRLHSQNDIRCEDVQQEIDRLTGCLSEIQRKSLDMYLRKRREKERAKLEKARAGAERQRKSSYRAYVRTHLEQLPTETLEKFSEDPYACHCHFFDLERKSGCFLLAEQYHDLARLVLAARKASALDRRVEDLKRAVEDSLDRMSPEDLRRLETDEDGAFTAFAAALLREYRYPMTAPELCDFVKRSLKKRRRPSQPL